MSASLTASCQHFSAQQKAQLLAMGISLYEPTVPIDLKQMPWIADVCKLLKISPQSCLFDSSQPLFNSKTQTLHLPLVSYANEANIKKSIWLSIRQFVD